MSPPEKHQPKRNEKRSFYVQQPADAIDAFVNNQHIDAPEQYEADKLGGSDGEEAQGMTRSHCRDEDNENFVNRIATDPGLDPEPTAGDKRAKESRDVRANGAK